MVLVNDFLVIDVIGKKSVYQHFHSEEHGSLQLCD